MRKDAHHGCPFSCFLCNFIIGMTIEIALSTCGNSGVAIFLDRKPFDLEYADGGDLDDSTGMFEICFVASKSETLLQGCISSEPNSGLARKDRSEVDGVNQLNSDTSTW